MHHLPRIFVLKKKHKSMDHSELPDRKSTDQSPSPRKLLRRNAAKNFNYTPSASASTSTSPLASGSSAPRSRSLDLPYDARSTSFRVVGKEEGELNDICKFLGISLEDFEIPTAEYELLKSNSSPSAFESPEKKEQPDLNPPEVDTKFVPHRCGNANTIVADKAKDDFGGELRKQISVLSLNDDVSAAPTPTNGGGIKGERPPLLNTLPPIALPACSDDDCCSHWELIDRFGPQSEATGGGIVETDISGSNSFSTNNDDDSSSSTTEAASIISPVSGFRINITGWKKGELLGRGSFGSVYEGMTSEGNFLAVKEVSLLEQGSRGKQSIYQLEQEIELLSQFEHENIVRYLGTDKVDSKLYIFLELVTQGSLSNLYQKYRLGDSHVSAYTRQILMGLKYLHLKNVVHRDIKCANILVAADGTVKLADFGLAKATRLNDLMSCKGTPFWMAPEVIYRQDQGYGRPADIWSLGCTVLEMLTGHVPYYPLEPQQALFRIGRGEPPPIPDYLSSHARDFIQQCLRVDPKDRPTAAELLDHPFLLRPLHNPLGSESPLMATR